MPHARPRPDAIARWLYLVAALVFAMVVVGGITRLTESGLSITEWKPLTGWIPPLSQTEWQAAFDAYKRIPEYAAFNRGMTLDAFKTIFFWEYIHRVLGRAIGLAFALPLAWFAWQRAIPKGYGWRLVALLLLGALQGAIGWWMVASGLTERTDVSHLRLAVHLMTAFLILGGLVWTALDLQQRRPARLTGFTMAAFAVLAVQLLLGALTAGLNAGYAFDTWPLMGDAIFPGGGWRPEWSAVRNTVDNPIVVQFAHRWWAFVALVMLVLLARRAKAHGDRPGSVLVHATVGTQILLGIATLLTGVNIVLAVLHQATGALLVIAATRAAHSVGRRT